MWRVGNLRRQCSFSNNYNKKEWILVNSLLITWWKHVLVYEHLKMIGLFMNGSLKNICESDVFVCNSLIDMYAKCGSIEEAWRIFNKMPSWYVVSQTTMILGYVKCRQRWKALKLFQQMQQGVQPNSVTFVGCWRHVPAQLHCMKASLFMSRSLKVDGIQMCLQGVAWLTCM